MLGQPLMPWQQYVADVAGEVLPDGTPAYREVVVTVPRQSGKTTLLLAAVVDRCVSWSRPCHVAWTGQTGKDARDKWMRDLWPAVKASPLRAGVQRFTQGMGNEALLWRNGSLVALVSTSDKAGHGLTLDAGVMDEIFADRDDRREQMLRPAMITRPDAQLWVASTAGTAASTVLNRKVEAGRRAVAEDSGEGVAYFEWSMSDDDDLYDERAWRRWMPALGNTIAPAAIRTELQSMEPAEARRAYGNRATAGTDAVIPAALWERVVSDDVKPDPGLGAVFGVDVAQDRASASIVVCDGTSLEVIEQRTGTGWVVERCNELLDRWGGAVVLDNGGPAGVLADSIVGECRRLAAREVIEACAALFDAVVESRVAVRRHEGLTKAVEGAVRRDVGDAWVWSRKSSLADPSPLMAASLAWWASTRRVEPQVFAY